MKKNKSPQTNILCHSINCKLNTSYRTEYKRGYCKSGSIAISSKNICLDKFTDDDGQD
jgi:hypothetical protein